MKLFCALIVCTVMFSFVTPGAVAARIVDARYTAPVDRYGHYALGRPHEYSSVMVTTDAGIELNYELPDNEVFEDLAPRIVKISADEPEEILCIVSHIDSGSRLVMLRLRAGGLELSAQSPAIGVPMRWLNPIGVADLDRDGQAEIAAVITPHIGGSLKVYRKQGGALIEIAAMPGFSNHVYRTPELALSATLLIDDKMRLLVPDASRLFLRIVSLEGGRLVETGACVLAEPVTGPVRMLAPGQVSVGLQSGRQVFFLNDCLH